MPPFENAFCTLSSIGIVDSGIQATSSRIGIRSVRPPMTARYPTDRPSASTRSRPVMIAALLGGTITIKALMVVMSAMTAPTTMPAANSVPYCSMGVLRGESAAGATTAAWLRRLATQWRFRASFRPPQLISRSTAPWSRPTVEPTTQSYGRHAAPAPCRVRPAKSAG